MGKLELLGVFLQVLREGSFSQAATKLETSPSAVSRAVTKLEASLQVKLFHRTTRSLSLTDEGRALQVGAEALIQDWELLAAKLRGRSQNPKGLLRVSVPSAVGRNLLVKHLVEYNGCYPEVRLDISFEDRMVDLAGQGFDLVVRTGELSDNATQISKALFQFQVVLCASPHYLKRSSPLQELKDIEKHTCLRFRNAATGRIFPWWLEAKGLQLSKGMVFDDGPALAKACSAGAGLAMLPTWLCAPLLREGQLQEVLPEHRRPFSTPVSLVYLNRQYVSPRVQSLVNFLLARREALERDLKWES